MILVKINLKIKITGILNTPVCDFSYIYIYLFFLR